MINATGLWKNKSKDGKTYMSGNLGGVRVLIYPNDNKQNEKSPDFNLVFAENKPKGDKRPKNHAPQMNNDDDFDF